MQRFPRLRALGAALRRFGARLKDFPGDRRGSAVVYVAAIAVPLVTIVGVSIDAARGYLVKSKLSQALDAAGLAGGRVALSPTRDDDIRMYFNTNFPPGYMEATLGVNDPQISMDPNAEELTLSASATIPTTFMRILGHEEMTVRASNVIHRTVKGMELVLVMDNTGSMYTTPAPSRMDQMKSAATDLVNILFGSRETAPNFWVALVPYVAVVNIGTTHGDWTFTPTSTPVSISSVVSKKSTTTNSPLSWRVLVTTATPHGFYNGQLVDIAGITGANNGVYNGRFMIRTSEPGAPATAPFTTNPITNAATQFVYYIDQGMSAFPISGFNPATGVEGQAGPPATVTGATVVRPQHAYPAGAWKGCVEARDTVAYEAASAEVLPTTEKWRRSYWPSTLNVRFYTVGGALLKDGTPARTGDNQWGIGRTPTVDERATGPSPLPGNNAYGPNLGCGPAITSLQPYKSKALAAIAEMQPWSRGGTMANLGLAWGWRVLSTTWRGMWGGDTPASYPLDYNSALVDKVVVLLTDGTNQWYDYPCHAPGNGNDGSCNGSNAPAGMKNAVLPNDADYTAYGRLAEGRLGTTSNATATTEVDNRMTALCTAMKAQNIIIYTIVVEVPSDPTKLLYRNCATKPEFAFVAPQASDLQAIFRQIATQLTNLRLAR
jgi:Flp pilus assembly protein TadG